MQGAPERNVPEVTRYTINFVPVCLVRICVEALLRKRSFKSGEGEYRGVAYKEIGAYS
jgi:hypothetical protein